MVKRSRDRIRKIIFLLLSAICLPETSSAAGLSISPDVFPIDFGVEVFAYEKQPLEQCKPVFTLTPDSAEGCSLSIHPDWDYTTPPGSQSIAFASPISDPTSIWVCISCQQPGDHDFHVLVESNCADLHPIIRFTCIGFARIQGTVVDYFTGQSLPDASVEALSYYLTITPSGNGAYSGVGRPGTQVLRVRANNYREQVRSVEISAETTLEKDFEMMPIVSLADVIGALKVVSGTPLPEPPDYHVDMNGDDRIGLEEAILLMQLLSGIR